MTTWARVAIVSTLTVVGAMITARPAAAQALGYGIAAATTVNVDTIATRAHVLIDS